MPIHTGIQIARWKLRSSIIFYGEYEEREVLAFVLLEVITSRVDRRDFFNFAMIRPSSLCSLVFQLGKPPPPSPPILGLPVIFLFLEKIVYGRKDRLDFCIWKLYPRYLLFVNADNFDLEKYLILILHGEKFDKLLSM